VRARAMWDERCARLRLALPGGFSSATYDVMGGSIQRAACGEVPGGRWVKLQGAGQALGFASDALYGYNLTPDGVLQASVARASRFTHEGRADVEDYPWYPVMDCGELRFNFLLTTDLNSLPRLAAELEQPPLVVQVSPAPGDWGKTGSLGSLSPQTIQLLTLKPSENGPGWVLRLQSTSSEVVTPQWTWQGQEMRLPPIQPFEVATFLVQKKSGAWSADPIRLTLLEEPYETL
jgi:alpha-mannosidase